MTVKIILFFVSIAVVFFTSVLIYRQRLGDAGDKRMKGFYLLCIVTLVWTALDAVKLFSAPDYYAFVFVPKVFAASVIPYVSFWFILNFTESKFAKLKSVISIIIAIPAFINLMLFTNPLHKLYFENFDYPDPSIGTIPPAGPFFIVNIVFITVGFLIFYTILVRYIIKNFRQYPILIITGIGLLVPFLLYLAFAVNLFGLVYDLSPIGFFCTIVLFTYFSYSSRTRNYRPKIFSETLVRITKSPKLSAGNIEDALRMIVKEGCIATGAHHVGIWNLHGNILKNTINYELKDDRYELQKDVDLTNCPDYMDMLLNERLIVINDVNEPNVLSNIINGYNPKICAILDTPIRINGKLIGIVSVEQHHSRAFPERRMWTLEERNFVSSLADLITIAMESAERYNLIRRTETMLNQLPCTVFQGIDSPSGFVFSFISKGMESLLGFSPSELINTSMLEFMCKIMKPKDAVNFSIRENDEAMVNTPLELIFEATAKDGTLKWLELRGHVVERNSAGKRNMIQGFFADVTERRLLDAAELANLSKDRFLAHMSHEMRTPMNAILGIAEIQLQNNMLSEETAEALGQIYESGDLLLSIVNDILDLSKIETGKMELLPVKYDIPSLINDTVQLNCLRYESRPIEFILHIDENTPHNLYGDELRIKQVLNNMLSNAFKYTDKGKIDFSVFAENESDDNVTLFFNISDTGQGMTEEQISVLFDEYTRFNVEANREIIGTGLGMNITKRLIDLMNGSISVQSEPGKGTIFTVGLPQKRLDKTVCGPELANNLRNFRYQSMAVAKRTQFIREYMPYGNVLVVDDVASNIYVAKGMLAPYGLNVDTSTSGFDAVKKIEAGNIYDIIFMDHMMPKMDGIEAAKIIRSLGYTKAIVALTANALIGQEKMFMENGFNDFISKPIDSREMNHILNDFIRNKQPPEVIEAARLEKQEKEKKNAEIMAQQAGAKSPPQKPSIDSDLTAAAICDIENALNILDGILPEIENGKTNFSLFITTVHGMKSALANIGEKELSDAALGLERAGDRNDKSVILTETPGFISLLRLFLKEIKHADTGGNADVSIEDVKFFNNKLNEIKTACEELDLKTAKSALNALKQKTWHGKMNDIVNEISVFLIRGEYLNAASVIDNAMEKEGGRYGK